MPRALPRLAPLAAAWLALLPANASTPAGAGTGAAREAPLDERPRVVLVLSGGGARGAAHIGVLEVLEELRVPVDAVVGTSMGAIVGGLYATGYAPGELAGIVADADWGTLLSDDPARDELWFRRRQDARDFQVDLQFGWKQGGPVLPPGLVLGRNIELFLERLTLPVAGIEDFDALRLPYRCVATDLADGSAVTFGRGNLPLAIRASMSLPGIFAPVEIDGRTLVDGGAVDNVPVDVARALGADVVVVVDISTPLRDADELGSALAVSDQVIGILMAQNRARAMALLGERDVAITPELGSVSTLSFDRASEAIELGRRAAREVAPRLAELAVDEATWGAYLERQRMPAWTPPTVRSLRITKDTRLSAAVLRRLCAVREGEPLDPERLAETRRRLAGLDLFEHVDVRVRPVGDGSGDVDVVLDLREKSWGPHYLRFGLAVSSDLRGEGEFDFGVQHTATPLNALGGEWRNEVRVGTRTRLFTEFYQPLDRDLRWFVAPSVRYEQDDLPLILDGERVAELGVEGAGASLAVGRNLGSWGELRASYGYLYATARPNIAQPGLLPGRIEIDGGEVETRLTLDTIDSITFPRHGAVGELAWRYQAEGLGNGRESSVLEASVGVPVTRGGLTVFTTLEGGATLDGEQALGGEFQLGGFRRLSGLGPGELSGNHYALAVLQPYWQFSGAPACSARAATWARASSTAGSGRSSTTSRPTSCSSAPRSTWASRRCSARSSSASARPRAATTRPTCSSGRSSDAAVAEPDRLRHADGPRRYGYVHGRAPTAALRLRPARAAPPAPRRPGPAGRAW